MKSLTQVTRDPI